MGRKGLVQEKADPFTLWVKIPDETVTGRTMQTLLHSLALQIRAEHMDRRVERFRVDVERRRIIILFENPKDKKEKVNDGNHPTEKKRCSHH